VQLIFRGESGDHAGKRQAGEPRFSDDRSDVAGEQEAVQPGSGIRRQQVENRANPLEIAEQRKIGGIPFCRQFQNRRSGAEGRFEADRRQYDLFIRVCNGVVERLFGRVNDHEPRFALKGAFGAGDAQQVAEYRDADVPAGERNGAVDETGARTAARASGAGEQPDRVRQQRTQPEFCRGEAVAAAHLHQANGTAKPGGGSAKRPAPE